MHYHAQYMRLDFVVHAPTPRQPSEEEEEAVEEEEEDEESNET